MLKTVGFDRCIQLKWLDAVATRFCSQNEGLGLIRSYMHDLLQCYLPNYEARRKTITVITRVWIRLPNYLVDFQQQAISLFNSVPSSERIWLHWGLTLVAYPFFRDIATTIGRLSLLQGELTSSQIHQRMQEKWGQRTTLARAIDRVLQSLFAWGVLKRGTISNCKTYRSCSKLETNNKHLQLWLVQAVIRSEGLKSMQVQDILSARSIFPFQFNITRGDLQRYAFLEYCKENLNSEVLTLNTHSQ